MTHDAATTLVLLIIIAFVFLVGYGLGWRRSYDYQREAAARIRRLRRDAGHADGGPH